MLRENHTNFDFGRERIPCVFFTLNWKYIVRRVRAMKSKIQILDVLSNIFNGHLKILIKLLTLGVSGTVRWP